MLSSNTSKSLSCAVGEILLQRTIVSLTEMFRPSRKFNMSSKFLGSLSSLGKAADELCQELISYLMI
jgi:hypothetical protein